MGSDPNRMRSDVKRSPRLRGGEFEGRGEFGRGRFRKKLNMLKQKKRD